jgi:hypothetical protein
LSSRGIQVMGGVALGWLVAGHVEQRMECDPGGARCFLPCRNTVRLCTTVGLGTESKYPTSSVKYLGYGSAYFVC